MFDPTLRSPVWAGVAGWLVTVAVVAIAGSWILGHYLVRFANGARIAAAVLGIVGLRLRLLALSC